MIGKESIFKISSETSSNLSSAMFEMTALSIFKHQYQNNSVYQAFCNHVGKDDASVSRLNDIPFLPIEFFKKNKIVANNSKIEAIFKSSRTTDSITSKHYITDIEIYKESYLKGFTHFYGEVSKYCILALLPSYLERDDSSLVYMVNDLIVKSKHKSSGFYLDTIDELAKTLLRLDSNGTKVMLIGVSFALLDLIENHCFQLKNTIVMETGGMKGRRKEMIREELHQVLQKGFGVAAIHSEYGMTELLSQAYSKGNGIFILPPWMKVLVRDTEDPFSLQPYGKTGGINVIDFANINSCSFIATQDLGKLYRDGSFEILGRFDYSDIRGCNLLAL